MRAPPRKTLREEVLLSLGVLMAAAVTLLAAAAVFTSERLLLSQRREAYSRAASSLGNALAAEATRGGPEALALAVPRLAREMRLSSLTAVDPDGRVLGSSREEERGSRVEGPSLLAARKGGMTSVAEGPAGELSFTGPLVLPRGWRGAWSVTFAGEEVAVALRGHRQAVLLAAVLDITVILLFGHLLLGRVAVMPVARVAAAARTLAGGDRSVRVPPQGTRELGELGDAFNDMAQRVEAAERALTEKIAALQQAQAELVRREKMASVGRLAAGVAHEIGNPLAAVLGYAALLRRGLPQEEMKEACACIERETERIRRIISELLDFARAPLALDSGGAEGGKGAGKVEMGEVVEAALQLVRPQEEYRGVELSWERPSGALPVRGDRHLLAQALVNLLLNAAQAQPGDKPRVVEVSLVLRGVLPQEVPSGDDRAPEYAPPDLPGRGALAPGGRAVAVTVTDRGPGIPPDVLPRVFDPFFTTKAPGQGTGLGLSLAYGIAAAHGGSLRAANRPPAEGSGAVFTLLLPCAEE